MLSGILKKLFGSHAQKVLKKLWPVVDEINDWYEKYESLSDDELKAKTPEFRLRLQDGETLDDLLPEAFAVVKQACKRHIGQEWMAGGSPVKWIELPYDVQLFGAIVLHQGRIAEMKTGEGKTLVAMIALYLNALEGRGCHLVTTNDYLAKRDSEWTGHLLEFLGITVGCINEEQDPADRREGYACDVTYGQNSTFGFDYLRDNMAASSAHLVQGARSRLSQTIVDEVLAETTPVEGTRVIADQFQTLIVEVPASMVSDLVSKYCERFSLDYIQVSWPGENYALTLPSLPARSVEVKQDNNELVPVGMAQVRFQFVRRDHHYAIVDEVDSILIDEARTPLIISGQVDRSTHQFDRMKPLVDNLMHYQASLINQIINDAEKMLEVDDGKARYDAGIKLLQVKKGMPKNRKLMKFLQEPEYSRLVGKVENDFIIDQKSKMGEKSMGYVEEDLYFVVDEKGHSVDLTEKGRAAVSPNNPDQFLLADIVDEFAKIEANPDLSPDKREEQKMRVRKENEDKSEELHNISQLLRAYTLFEKDVEYVVQDNKVIIVDEFTGRLQPGRRYSDGLHQAIEAKESVQIEKETQTLATITIQNYFRMYDKLSGMTGTAETEAAEFGHTYKMEVVVIPTNKPIARLDFDDVIYRTRREKYNAIIEEIVRLNKMGLPILVGTVNVEVSELLSRMLKRTGVSHSVLNAKYHEKEAEIVRGAGRSGAVTIATNMAGRGVDIKLGDGVIKCKAGESHDGQYCPACPFKPEGAKVNSELQPCGLQIIGTERHEARRIDNQLRGRSGRQGDPGSTRFFLSLEDDLMRLFGSDRIASIMQRLGLQEGEDIQHPFITGAITRAQRKIEEMHFETRKRTLDYDNVMNKQRESIYGLRREVLINDNLKGVLLDLCYDALAGAIDKFKNTDPITMSERPYDLDLFEAYVRGVVGMVDLNGIEHPLEPNEAYLNEIVNRIDKAYDLKCELLGPDLARDLTRYIVLMSIDQEWRDHLAGIDELREGIHLRSYAQVDPLVEYQRDATYMFQDMMASVQRIAFEHFFRANIVSQQRQPRASQVDYGRGSEEPIATGNEGADNGNQNVVTNNPDGPPRPQTYHRDRPKIGPNEKCPCGSGKKYKKCCGLRD